MKTRKSLRKQWSEKLASAHEAKVVAIPPKMQKQLGKGTIAGHV